MRDFQSAAAAGAAIAVGAAAYLSCSNQIVGAFLFSVALFTICVLNLNLYTGKVGYFFETTEKAAIAVTWLGNLTGGVIAALLLRLAKPELTERVSLLIQGKMGQNPLQTAILAMFCGMMMYIAIHNYRYHKSDLHRVLGIVLCIMAFIICGFEHSIADMCYFTLYVHSWPTFGYAACYIPLVTLFNGVGATLYRLLTRGNI